MIALFISFHHEDSVNKSAPSYLEWITGYNIIKQSKLGFPSRTFVSLENAEHYKVREDMFNNFINKSSD